MFLSLELPQKPASSLLYCVVALVEQFGGHASMCTCVVTLSGKPRLTLPVHPHQPHHTHVKALGKDKF